MEQKKVPLSTQYVERQELLDRNAEDVIRGSDECDENRDGSGAE